MAADPSAAPASDGEVSVALRDSEVFPGDIVAQISTFKRVVLGAGVVRDGTAIRSTKVGKLRWHEADCKLWVQSEQKRYIPELDDHVIGIVTDRHTDEYLVDIGAPAMASLPLLGFDGATKRNRPQARERKKPRVRFVRVPFVRVPFVRCEVSLSVPCQGCFHPPTYVFLSRPIRKPLWQKLRQ